MILAQVVTRTRLARRCDPHKLNGIEIKIGSTADDFKVQVGPS